MTKDMQAEILDSILCAIIPHHRHADDSHLYGTLAIEFELMDDDTLAAIATALKVSATARAVMLAASQPSQH